MTTNYLKDEFPKTIKVKTVKKYRLIVFLKNDDQLSKGKVAAEKVREKREGK